MAERVLWLVKGLGRGGTERILTVAARHVDRSRYAVDVAYVQPWKDAVVPDLEAAGVRVHLLGPAGSEGSTRGWPLRLQRLLAAERYAIVHTHSPVPAVAARLLPGARRSALVHTEHSAWGRYVPATRIANLATYGRNRHVLAVSEGVGRSIHRPGWAPWLRLPPVEVLYHGIDEADVRRGPEARAAGREVLGLPADAVVIGTVGNLTPKKDHRSLVEAFARLAADRPDAHLVIVGGGVLHDELAAQVAATGLGDRIHLPGQRPDVATLLPAFDVFALSSKHEGLGLAVVEAMASGVPVVATEVDGVPEVVTDGVDGVLVPPGRPDRLAAAVGDLLDDPARAATLAEKATATATRFSIPAAVDRIQTVYDELCASVHVSGGHVHKPRGGGRREGPAVEVRAATEADEPAILALLQTSLGGGPVGERTTEFFAWKHHANPFGASYAFVAEVDGEVVGFRTLMRWRWRADERTYEAVRAVDTATHPDHQGRGIFTRLTLGALDAIDGRVDLVFNTPNANSRPGYLKMGWSDVGTVPIAIRPVRPLRFARGARSARTESAPPVIDCALPPAAEVLADPALDDLVAQVAGGGGRLATDRSASYLRWRYDAPGLDYRAVAVHDGGELVAVAVGRPRARGPLAELTLSELIVRAGDTASASTALREVVSGCGCDHVAAVPGLDPALVGTFRRRGFLPVPGQGMVLTTNPRTEVRPDPRRLGSWAFALGDLEVF